MSHLSLEVLARLVDEEPDPAEARHLRSCALCREELAALREQVLALGSLPDIEPAPDAWPALEARLIREGLLRADRRSWILRSTSLVRFAAMLVIFLAGGLTGAALRGPVAPAEEAPGYLAEVAPGDVALAASEDPWLRTTDADELARVLRARETAYMAALARYAEVSGAAATPDPIARLATLESILAATRAALNEAPADPVINGYHLTALAQRDAIYRQLAIHSEEPWF